MILTIDLENNVSVTLVSCYSQTMASSEQEKGDFYNQLHTVISRVQYMDKLILVGDFNARVGTDYQTWEWVLGHHGVGKINSNSLRLLSICREFDLTITNTLFQQPNHRKTTWMHPRSKDWHMIDFVITRNWDRRDIKITRSFHNTCYLSDYALLRSKALLRLARRRLQKSSIPKRINTLSLKSNEKQAELYNKLDTSLESVEIHDDIESSWKALRDATYEASLEVLGLPVRKHQDWLDDNNTEVQLLIQQMNDSHKAWINDKNSSAKMKAFNKCKSQVQSALRKMNVAWWSAKVAELQEAADRKDSKVFYNGLKEMYGPRESGASPVLSADGQKLLTDKTEILLRWK